MNRPIVSRPFHDPSGQLHHLEISVSDLQASTEFWDWLLTELGYARYHEWGQGVSWKRRDTSLALVQSPPEEPDIPHHRDHAGLSHLAFHARSRRQVDDISQELQRRGIPVLFEDASSGSDSDSAYNVYFEDPDHIKIELVAPD